MYPSIRVLKEIVLPASVLQQHDLQREVTKTPFTRFPVKLWHQNCSLQLGSPVSLGMLLIVLALATLASLPPSPHVKPHVIIALPSLNEESTIEQVVAGADAGCGTYLGIRRASCCTAIAARQIAPASALQRRQWHTALKRSLPAAVARARH